MERGPLALFGAILAIGLGPAMWLGAQFGESTTAPQRPPAVTVQQNEVIPPAGGAGAGDTPTGPAQIIATEPAAESRPLTATSEVKPAASPSSSASSRSAETVPSTSAPATSTSPTPDGTDSTTEPDDSGTPPTESTTEPTDDPTGDPTGESADPDLPTTDATGDSVPAAYDPA